MADEIIPKSSEALTTVTAALARVYLAEFEGYATARKPVEDEWLDNIRAFNGQYPPDVKARLDQDPNRSKVFVKLPRVKVMAALARLLTVLFPTNEKVWSIDPTPIPDLGAGAPPVIAGNGNPPQVSAPAQAGVPLMVPSIADTQAEIQKATKEIAEIRAKAMEIEINDQLMEADWETKVIRALMELCVTGSMVISGPLVRKVKRERWYEVKEETKSDLKSALSSPSSKNGSKWEYGAENTKEELKPAINYCSVFTIYPDPLAYKADECTAIYRRHVMSRDQVLELRGQPGFKDDEITAALLHYPKGNWVARHFEVTLPSVTTQGGSRQGTYLGTRYEVLERTGSVSGQDLRNAGDNTISDEKLAEEFQANTWILGDHCIKIAINPTRPKLMPYHIVPYEVVDYRIWGRGVPAMMSDSSAMLNASTRAMLDNMAIASGPQVEITEDLLVPGQDSSTIWAWKIWRTKLNNTQHPALRVWKIDSIVTELMALAENFRKLIDEETNLPSYTSGQQTEFLNETASGMSMLIALMDKITRATVKNIDVFLIQPLISAMYHWNMRYNPKPEIKGDMKIIARGASVLMAKEIYVQKILQFLQLTANDRDIVDRAELVVELANALELKSDKIVRSAEKIQAYQMQLAQQQKEQQDPEIIELTKQKILAEIKKLKAEAILSIARAEAEEKGSQLESYKAELEALKSEHSAELDEGRAIQQKMGILKDVQEAEAAREKAKRVGEELRGARSVAAPAETVTP